MGPTVMPDQSGPLPKNLSPLLARLGSDSDGERMACLRQIDRMLGRVGMSWTDLARRMEDGPRPARGAPDPEQEKGRPRFTSWGQAIRWISEHPDWDPTANELDFVTKMDRIVQRYSPTEKQAKWIRDILDRLGTRP